jgi:hypothetical protein
MDMNIIITFRDEEPIFTKGTTPKQIAHAVDEVAATIRSASSFSVVGLDCEYVGVGFHGAEDQVARVSVVNDKGEPIYDKYVKPLEEVTDFRVCFFLLNTMHKI